VTNRTRYLRRMLFLMMGLILTFALWRTESQADDPAPTQQTPSKDFGRPVSLETGTEQFPLRQGFLKCADEQLNPDFQHGHTDKLFDNLSLQSPTDGRAVSVGHGSPGLQCTGEGDHCGGTDKTLYMDMLNTDVWKPLASKIKGKYRLLTLLGCEIGQGNDGADFLYEMAKTIDAHVRAPDSIIFCRPNGIYFDPGGKWVEATPQSKPTPHLYKPFEVKETAKLQFRIEGAMRTLKPEDVQFLEFQHRTYHQKDFTTLRGFGPAILQSVGFGKPFETPGRPAAIVTGSFRLRLHWEGKPLERQFVLYNDVLVEDLEEQDVFYRVNRVGLLEYIARLSK
jgi:hypothetical protein